MTDIELPGMSGLELLDQVRELVPGLPVAVLTGHPSVDYAVSALRGSAAIRPSGPASRRRPPTARQATRPAVANVAHIERSRNFDCTFR
jgi:DNA-binding NtrC family response regulator